MTRELTAESLRDFVTECQGRSFVEIERRFDGTKGDMAIGLPEKNIWFWFGLSQQAVDAIQEARTAYGLELKPCSHLVYWVDGGVLQVPIAKANRAYKSQRWMPVVFNLAKEKKR